MFGKVLFEIGIMGGRSIVGVRGGITRRTCRLGLSTLGGTAEARKICALDTQRLKAVVRNEL